MRKRDRMMWVDERFFDFVKAKVEYDKNVLKKVKRYKPDADIYGSCAEATGAIYDRFIYPKVKKKSRSKKNK